MDIDKIYEELAAQKQIKNGKIVKITDGFFGEDDLVNIGAGLIPAVFFKIDKDGLIDVLNELIPSIEQIDGESDFFKMINTLVKVQNGISNYYGKRNNQARIPKYYEISKGSYDDDAVVCTLSQLKGLGIAECAEKASLANNVLLILNKIGLFDYKVKYIESIVSISDIEEGHAYLEFDRVTTKGDNMHIIYDVTNPEKVKEVKSGELFYYPALYCLNDNEYEDFLMGEPIDNSHFILAADYEPISKRSYSGYHVD